MYRDTVFVLLSYLVYDSIKLYFKDVLLFLSAHALIDPGNLLTPPLPFPVFHIDDLIKRPVEVICDKGYLLVQPVEGVAYYSPRGSASASNSCSHLGQVAFILLEPFSLILL